MLVPVRPRSFGGEGRGLGKCALGQQRRELQHGAHGLLMVARQVAQALGRLAVNGDRHPRAAVVGKAAAVTAAALGAAGGGVQSIGPVKSMLQTLLSRRLLPATRATLLATLVRRGRMRRMPQEQEPEPQRASRRSERPAGSPYEAGVSGFKYGEGLMRAFEYLRSVPPALPASPRPFMPGVVHEMLMGVVGTVVEKWEKPAAWLLTGFAAVVALMVANYDKAAGLIGAGTLHVVALLFFLAVLAHAVQQFFSTLVQAGVAGGKVGRELKLDGLNKSEFHELLDGLVAAYPWPMKRFLRSRYDELLEHGLAPMSRLMALMTATVVWSVVIQLVCGVFAIGAVTWSVGRIAWTPAPAAVQPSTALPADAAAGLPAAKAVQPRAPSAAN